MPDVSKLFEDDVKGTKVCDIETIALGDPIPEPDLSTCESNEAKLDVEVVEFMMPDCSRPFEDDANVTEVCDTETVALGDPAPR